MYGVIIEKLIPKVFDFVSSRTLGCALGLAALDAYADPRGIGMRMCSPFTAPEVCERMLGKLISCLDGGAA